MYNKKEDCMNNLTKIWNDLTAELVDKQHSEGYLEDLNKKFGEIFDIKDVTEYKAACMDQPFFTPSQFAHLSNAMRRALVEGYILAQIERKKEDIKLLYNCYREDIKQDEKSDFDAPIVGDVPRCSVSGDDKPRPVRKKRRQSVLPFDATEND